MPPSTIIKECSRFLSQSDNNPLFKLLPSHGEGFRKIKMRKKRTHEHEIEKYFDMAFMEEYKDLRLRSMIAHTKEPSVITEGKEPFYIFPIDGFKILVNPVVDDYNNYIFSLERALRSANVDSQSILNDLFSNGYIQSDIKSAATHKSDVFIYGISHYYAIRKSLIDSYDIFISY